MTISKFKRYSIISDKPMPWRTWDAPINNRLSLDEVLQKLLVIKEHISGDQTVYMGDFHSDQPVFDVVIENGYVLIVAEY